MMYATRELAALSGAVVIGKGSPTFVAAGDQLYLLARPNPALAAAGSGDVLAGAVAALAAQGLAPIDAARLGVWLHARAGSSSPPTSRGGRHRPSRSVARHLARGAG